MWYKNIIFRTMLTYFSLAALSMACQSQVPERLNTVGTILNTEGVSDGYVLFTVHNNTYLINNCGEVVHRWTSDYASGKSVYLLENGNLLRAAEVPDADNIIIPGKGGRIELFDWEGTLIWEYNYSSFKYSQHHEVYPMPNGNILVLAVTVLSESEARELGRRLLTPPRKQLYNEQILELKPKGTSQADIVWEWNLTDHLVQDLDPGKSNYGKASDHPGRLDINFLGTSSGSANWLHINSAQYNEERDQIVLCSRHLNEIYVIDHSTSTAEAATSSGGNQGKGGDFLYRWGNPSAYGHGTDQHQQLFGPHAAHWIEGDQTFAGKIIIFNNGVHRSPEFSEVYIIDPPIDSRGEFVYHTDSPYGPSEPVYTYKATDPADFYAEFLSNAQSLPNGNILICSGEQGRFFEINENQEIVWEYVNPVGAKEILQQGDEPNSANNNVFRAMRYPADYKAFDGRQLKPEEPIESSPNLSVIYNCN